MNDGARTDFVWRTHAYINEYIRLADTKAGALSAAFGALIAVLVHQYTTGTEPLTWWRMALFASAMVSSGCVLLLAFDVVRPRTRDLAGHGLIFWEYIRAHTRDDFVSSVAELEDGPALREVGSHTYELAGIAQTKYARLKCAFFFSYVALPLALLGLPLL